MDPLTTITTVVATANMVTLTINKLTGILTSLSEFQENIQGEITKLDTELQAIPAGTVEGLDELQSYVENNLVQTPEDEKKLKVWLNKF